MLPSHSGILAKATRTLVKTFSIVFFLSLHYTFVTDDEEESNKQQVKSKNQKVKSYEQRLKNSKQRAKSNVQRAKTNEQRTTTKKFSLVLKMLIALIMVNKDLESVLI